MTDTPRRRPPVLAVTVLLLAAGSAGAVEPEGRRRGLVTTYREAARPARQVTRLEPTVALALGEKEAPHPRLPPDGAAVWKGYLNVVRGGKHTFSVRLRGGLTV